MSGHGGVDGELDEVEDDLDLAGAGAAAAATPKRESLALDELLDRLDTLGDLDDLGAGGVGGLATGVEIIGDGFVHGPDDLLDSFEPARDLAEGVDVFDDLF